MKFSQTLDFLTKSTFLKVTSHHSLFASIYQLIYLSIDNVWYLCVKWKPLEVELTGELLEVLPAVVDRVEGPFVEEILWYGLMTRPAGEYEKILSSQLLKISYFVLLFIPTKLSCYSILRLLLLFLFYYYSRWNYIFISSKRIRH